MHTSAHTHHRARLTTDNLISLELRKKDIYQQKTISAYIQTGHIGGAEKPMRAKREAEEEDEEEEE